MQNKMVSIETREKILDQNHGTVVYMHLILGEYVSGIH